MSAFLEEACPEGLWMARTEGMDNKGLWMGRTGGIGDVESSSGSEDEDEMGALDDIKSEGSDDVRSSSSACEDDRPVMRPCQPGARVFSSMSTHSSRLLAAEVKQVALRTSAVHGTSTTGTPWLYARRLAAIKEQNALFLAWCRSWIEELYGTPCTAVRAPRTEPHIVKYDHKLQSTFKGIGTHQDGSFVTCIMALSEPDEYTGGGTYFPHLAETVRPEMGGVLLFQGMQGPYSAPHRAQPIGSGKRLLYIAFFKLRKVKAVKKKKKKTGTPNCATARPRTQQRQRASGS